MARHGIPRSVPANQVLGGFLEAHVGEVRSVGEVALISSHFDGGFDLLRVREARGCSTVARLGTPRTIRHSNRQGTRQGRTGGWVHVTAVGEWCGAGLPLGARRRGGHGHPATDRAGAARRAGRPRHGARAGRTAPRGRGASAGPPRAPRVLDTDRARPRGPGLGGRGGRPPRAGRRRAGPPLRGPLTRRGGAPRPFRRAGGLHDRDAHRFGRGHPPGLRPRRTGADRRPSQPDRTLPPERPTGRPSLGHAVRRPHRCLVARAAAPRRSARATPRCGKACTPSCRGPTSSPRPRSGCCARSGPISSACRRSSRRSPPGTSGARPGRGGGEHPAAGLGAGPLTVEEIRAGAGAAVPQLARLLRATLASS